jgi:hypothetical protein
MIILALAIGTAPALPLAAAPPIQTPPAAAAARPSVNFSQMRIEDAVMLMFELISKDARADTRAMLSEMDQTRRKRSSMREAATMMTRELQRLKASARDGGKGNAVWESQIAWVDQLPALCGNLRGEDRQSCLESAMRRRTLELRAEPGP